MNASEGTRTLNTAAKKAGRGKPGLRRRHLLLGLGAAALGRTPAAFANDDRDHAGNFGRIFRLPP